MSVDRWVSFDCYGTLVNWRRGMEDALASVASPPDAAALFDGYHRHEHALQSARPFPSYRSVLTDGLSAAATELDLTLSREQAGVLADTLPTWPVFEETARTLQQLREDGWRLAILSNVDNVMIQQTLELLGAPIDVVVTSQDVGSYKPELGHFHELARRTGAGPTSWVHVACSWFHDVVPATAVGVRSIFVNRESEKQDDSLVAATLPDLAGLSGALREVLA